MKRSTIVLALALLLFGASSCKKADTTTTPSSLIGTWTKPYQSYTVGVVFKSDNTFSFGIFSGSTYAETITGHYTNTSSDITFSNQSGPMESCPGAQCIYNYTISGSTCTLSVNTDTCTGRSSKIVGTWTKQP